MIKSAHNSLPSTLLDVYSQAFIQDNKMKSVQDLVRNADPRSFASIEEAAVIIRDVEDLSLLLFSRGSASDSESEGRMLGRIGECSSSITEMSLGLLLKKLCRIAPLLHAKNGRILELFSDFPVIEPCIPGVQERQYVLPCVVALSLFICAAAASSQHASSVTPVPALLPATGTSTTAATVFHRTFCTSSVRTRISLLSSILSLGAAVRPEHVRTVHQYIEKGCETLLSHYLSEGMFSLPSWAGSDREEVEMEGDGDCMRKVMSERRIACSDLFLLSLQTLSTPTFVQSLLLFGAFNADRAHDAARGKEGVSTGRGSIGGGGRPRKSAKESDENNVAEALRLNRLSLSLLDLLLRGVMARYEREQESRMHSEPEASWAMAAVWGPALPLLKQVEWRSDLEQSQGQRDGERRGDRYGQSTISLFVQMLEDENYSSSSSSSSSNSGSSSSSCNSYGRSMVLGLFHMSPQVRASSALRLRHELSGLQAPCEAAVQRSDR